MRKGIEFYDVTIPTRNEKPQHLVLTAIEFFSPDLFAEARRPQSITIRDERERALLKRRLVPTILEAYLRLLEGDKSNGPLNAEFVTSLLNEQSVFQGRNSLLVLSEPDDFSKILAMVRVAKPSIFSSLLPLHYEFKSRLLPLPKTEYQPVEGNRIKIYRYRNPEPSYIELQNASVYSGDSIELKHYGATFRRNVDLTAVLFHAGQELGVFPISRYLADGSWEGLPPGPVILAPSTIVAVSDTPDVLSLLDSFKFVTHQTFPGEIRPERTTKVLYGTPEQFGEGFYHWNLSRRNGWQLAGIKFTKLIDETFLFRFLRENCSHQLVSSLQRLDRAAERRLHEAVRRFSRSVE